jgi:hypothetical protein
MNAVVLTLCLASELAVGTHKKTVVVVPVAPVVAPVIERPALRLPPPVPAVVLPAVKAPTPAEFAASFQPAPGAYRVTLLHPFTCCPVEVCFTLPPGCPRVEVNKRQLEFDYGKHEVRVNFRRNGSVEVDHD